MAYDPNELFSSKDGVGSGLRAVPQTVQPKTFAGGSGTLKRLTPVTFNTGTNDWKEWGTTSAQNEISRISANATAATGGTFTLTVDGETTAAIDYDAAPADVKSALEALSGVDEVTVSMNSGNNLGENSAEMDVEFTGAKVRDENLSPSINTGNLTGNAHTLAEQQAGSAGSVDTIHGFVWPDEIELVSGKEVIGNVMLQGKVHYDDIVLPSGESIANLQKALRDGPRDLGLIVQGLDQVR